MAKLWDPFADQYRTDPYPMYHRLRVESPVHVAQSGDIVLTQHQHIKSILLNSTDFRTGNRLDWIIRQVKHLENKDEDLSAIADAMNNFIVMMNPPEHMQLRNLLMEAWDDHEIDQIIKENVDQLLDQIHGKKFDLISDFAELLPALTMTRIMGLPSEDYQHLKKIASGVLRSLDMYTSFKDLVQINKFSKSFITYLNRHLDYRELNLSTDLVSKIIKLYRKKNIPITRKQLISTCIFLFMAGEETTSNLIGTGLLNLLRHPDQCNQVMADPKLMDGAFDEALRFEAPVQLVGRIANMNVEIEGVTLKKESTLTLCLGAANRDPEVFEEPDSFNIFRNAKNHLSFGAGVHFCLGSWLAKKNWKIAVQEILLRFPSIKVEESPAWNTMLSVRGLSSFKVSVS